MIHPAGPFSRNILAADIGGTHARFAAVRVERSGPNGFRAEPGTVFQMNTRQPGADSFVAFWRAFRSQAPAELASEDAFDAVALALAGSVSGQSAVLPNIEWNICPADTRPFARLCLVNDFVAQGHALAAAGALDSLEWVRPGQARGDGVVALVGAGTGLGHCALVRPGSKGAGFQPWQVLGSEAGHCTFAFKAGREQEIERLWLKASGKAWLSNDDVVSGSGLVQLHACLAGRTVAPVEALRHDETAAWFSRFYARSCRNYCLSLFPVDCLVLSGGIAARNPHLVKSSDFTESFDDANEYRELLERIPIRLNTDPHIGIRGAALCAAQRLFSGD